MSEKMRSPRPIVVIVDDEEDILTFLDLAFADHGFEVVCTPDSRAAMDLMEASAPDLICLDLLMPQQTGVALYKSLCGHPQLKACPIIIMSGLAVRGEIQSMLRGSGEIPLPAAIVEKPIDIEELLAIADRLVGTATEASP